MLFGEEALPVLPAVVAAAAKWEHNGRYTLNDEVLCAEIAERVLTGLSNRAIARLLRVSRSTVRAVMFVLEERGKLGPLKQRLSRKLGYALELCVDRSIEALEDNKVPMNVLPILGGVWFDKKALIDGDPTARVEHGQAETVSIESFKAWLAELKANRGAHEVESSAPTAIPEASGGGTVVDTGCATPADGAERAKCTVSGGGDQHHAPLEKSTMDREGEIL